MSSDDVSLILKLAKIGNYLTFVSGQVINCNNYGTVAARLDSQFEGEFSVSSEKLKGLVGKWIKITYQDGFARFVTDQMTIETDTAYPLYDLGELDEPYTARRQINKSDMMFVKVAAQMENALYPVTIYSDLTMSATDGLFCLFSMSDYTPLCAMYSIDLLSRFIDLVDEMLVGTRFILFQSNRCRIWIPAVSINMLASTLPSTAPKWKTSVTVKKKDIIELLHTLRKLKMKAVQLDVTNDCLVASANEDGKSIERRIPASTNNSFSLFVTTKSLDFAKFSDGKEVEILYDNEHSPIAIRLSNENFVMFLQARRLN